MENELEQMRIRLAEMAAEVERLNAVIDSQKNTAVAAPYTIGFSQALKICEIGFKCWSEKPHNKKWFKRIDGTPIPNDLICCIAEAFSDSENSDDNLMELHALSRFEESCFDAVKSPRITEHGATEIESTECIDNIPTLGDADRVVGPTDFTDYIDGLQK